jgi:hypothetical protein
MLRARDRFAAGEAVMQVGMEGAAVVDRCPIQASDTERMSAHERELIRTPFRR